MTEINEVIDVVDNAFKTGNEEFPDYLCDYVERWVKYATSLTFIHFKRLIRSADLPDELWTGTGGNVWTRILRYAVLESGGLVVGHDHAMGSGFAREHKKELTELSSCDKFITFTSNQAENLRNNTRPEFLSSEPPEITSTPGLGHKPLLRPPRALKRLSSKLRANWPSEVRELMYVPTVYSGDQPRFRCLFPDRVMIDWQARLLHILCDKMEYEVLHKPHPEGASRPPESLIANLGIEVINDPFEHVLHLPDAFLFDMPVSTTFGVALLSNKPVILIDFGFFDWTTEARDMLEQRCAIVEGWLDDENRAHVDWTELTDAIKRAVDLDDTTFTKTYLLETGGI